MTQTMPSIRNFGKPIVLALAIVLATAAGLRAQDGGAAAAAPGPGIHVGAYQVQSMLEAGYRNSNVEGNIPDYDQFVDLNSGLRLFDGSLVAHAVEGQPAAFDNLSFTAFGLGGDPQQVVRLRADRGKLYDFSGDFRRDVNYFGYNLLSNPLNPSTFTAGTPTAQTTALHAMDLSHRMWDYNLKLLPLSKVSFRLGYSRNVQTGPADTSLHGNVDTQLLQNYRTTMNSYRLGVDYKPFARTLLSFDEFLEYFKNDTTDTNPTNGVLSNGTPVDIGFTFTGTTPCNPVDTSSGIVNPICKGYLSYSRVAPTRTALPTEHASLHSDYYRNLSVNGQFSYNTGKNTVPGYSELVNGLTSVTRGTDTSASALANRVQVNGDGSVTWKLGEQGMLNDTATLNRFENPGDYAFNEATLFAQGPLTSGTGSLLVPPAVFNATNCPAPYTALTCPQHTTSSAADIQNGITYSYLGDNTRANLAQFTWNFTPSWGARIGWRYVQQRVADGTASFTTSDIYDPGSGASLADRGSCALVNKVLPAACHANSDGSVTYTNPVAPTVVTPAEEANIHGNALLVGMFFRPSSQLRLNTSMEFYDADHSFDRIDPRESEKYAVHASYAPYRWANVDGTMNIFDTHDNTVGVGQLSEARNYNLMLTLTPPTDRATSFELGYNYNYLYSASEVCFSLGSSPVPAGVGVCPIAGSPVTQGALGFYRDLDHFYYADTNWTPVKRVSLRAGYAGDFVGGSTLVLNPLTPDGPTIYHYLKPFANLQASVVKGVDFNFNYGYYDYRELGTVAITGLAPIPSDNFHGNLLRASLRWSF